MTHLLLATRSGFAAATADPWRITARALNGRSLTSLIAREGTLLAGAEDGLFRSTDGGATWHPADRGLAERHVRWLAFHPDISNLEFAGTEPAALFVSRDGGDSWQECPEVAALRDQFGWWLPYSPAAGCVRGFAFHGQRAYAAVEVGGALRSDDAGATWQLAPGSDGRPRFTNPASGRVHPDVHSIATHPRSPDLVLAPTGGGFYRSTDGGHTWQQLHASYCRAVWVDPADAQHLVLGPADGPDGRNGRIEVSRDGGATWTAVTPAWSANMVERFTRLDDALLAVTANGQLFHTSLAAPSWQPILPDAGHVTAATTMH